MTSPKVITAVLGVVCLLAVFGVLTQQRELTGLRAEQKQVLAQIAAEPNENSLPAAQRSEKATESAISNPELLQLRSEITRLTQRKRELGGIIAEHERLQAQVASRGTNGFGANAGRLLLPGRARMAGYNSPEDTMESVLWALQHGDVTNFLQAFPLEVAQTLPVQTPEAWTKIMNEFHEQFTGLSILRRRELPDGRVELTVQLAGQEETEQLLHFRQVNGQWKVEDLK